MANLISFLMAHKAALSGVAVALIDFAIEVAPALKGNNLVSFLLNLLNPKA